MESASRRNDSQNKTENQLPASMQIKSGDNTGMSAPISFKGW